MTPLLRLVLPALALLLVGCHSDTSLRAAPPLDPVSEEPGIRHGGGPGGGPGGWPGLPTLPSGPWGELDPGSMPDIYFVVAHGDPGCCWDCDGVWLTGDAAGAGADEDADGLPPINNSDGDVDSEVGWECQVEYAIVDIHGQVVAEFNLPGQDENQYAWWTHLRIIPSGPGRFLATAYGWTEPYPPYDTDDEYDEELPENDGPLDEDEESDYPEPGAWVPWSAWEINAVTETITPVAWQDGSTREIVMVETGRRVDIGPAWAGVQAAISPDDPEWLMLWAMEYDCVTELRPLRAVNRLDVTMLDRLWNVEDLLPPAMVESGVPLSAFSLEPSIDDEGRATYLLGVTDYGCGGGFAPVTAVVNWSPTNGARWYGETSWSGYYYNRVSFAGWNGGGALLVDSPYEPSSWHVIRGDGETVDGLVSGMSWGVRPGPMLDPAGPSFALLGVPENSTTYGDAIHFIHGGEKVWQIDGLRFGLQTTPVTVFDVIVLPPWDQPE